MYKILYFLRGGINMANYDDNETVAGSSLEGEYDAALQVRSLSVIY